MPPQKVCNPIAIGPEKWHIAEAQDKDAKIIINMFKDFKEDANESLNEVYGNTNEQLGGTVKFRKSNKNFRGEPHQQSVTWKRESQMLKAR